MRSVARRLRGYNSRIIIRGDDGQERRERDLLLPSGLSDALELGTQPRLIPEGQVIASGSVSGLPVAAIASRVASSESLGRDVAGEAGDQNPNAWWALRLPVAAAWLIIPSWRAPVPRPGRDARPAAPLCLSSPGRRLHFELARRSDGLDFNRRPVEQVDPGYRSANEHIRPPGRALPATTWRRMARNGFLSSIGRRSSMHGRPVTSTDTY